MTWTYIPVFTTQRDRVRREIGDTVSTEALLSDEEIQYAGSVETSDLGAAARACEFIAAGFSRKADMSEGKLSIKLSQRKEAYELKARLLRAAATSGATVYIGGESVSDKEATDDDSDRVPPAFWRGQLDNPQAEQDTPGNSGTADNEDN